MTEPTNRRDGAAVQAASSLRRQRLVLFAGAVVIVAAVLAILFVDSPGSTSSMGGGEPAPVVPLMYLDGAESELAALVGAPIVLNFFADWCPACVAEMPDFERVHQAFGEDVVFLGVDRSGSDSGAMGLIESTGITYEVAVDRDGSIFQAFGGLAMPTTVFIAAGGTIVGQHNGVIFEDDLTERIDALFFGN